MYLTAVGAPMVITQFPFSAFQFQGPITADALEPLVGASKKCNCKRSKCLKLYCECFAAKVLCEGCKCVECENTQERSQQRRKAVRYKLARNRAAFDPKIKSGAAGAQGLSHARGCNCQRSACTKKYCECFQGGTVCSDSCKCVGCANDGSLSRVRFGMMGWLVPDSKEPTGPQYGKESLMMILPSAEGKNESVSSGGTPKAFPRISDFEPSNSCNTGSDGADNSKESSQLTQCARRSLHKRNRVSSGRASQHFIGSELLANSVKRQRAGNGGLSAANLQHIFPISKSQVKRGHDKDTAELGISNLLAAAMAAE